MVASFAVPLILWSFFAYTPGLWDISHKLKITTDVKSGDYPTIYRPSHVMEKERYLAFQEMVRETNSQIQDYHAGKGELPEGISVSSRSNSKILRKLHPIAVEMEWMTEEQGTDNDALFAIWGDLATGSRTVPTKLLSAENLEIIKINWEMMSAGGDQYDSSTFPKEPLLHLIPHGERAVGRPSYLPAPHQVLLAGRDLMFGTSQRVDAGLGNRYADSLGIVFMGFLFACLIGLPIGLLAGTFDFFSKLFEPFVDFFRYMPAPAFGTLLVFLLGSHDAPKVALVFLGTVCQAILMTANTTRQLDTGLLDAAQTLGARKFDLVFKVVIPGVIHNLYNDLRILLGWAWTWLVIAELMGVKSGLTEIIDTHGRRFNFDIVYATILLIGITGFVSDQFLSKMRPVLFPWVAEKKTGFMMRSLLWLPNWLKQGANERNEAMDELLTKQTSKV
tara:strand:+ start:9632 stop:10972 length:1341 start_codon:yes stop_codon:yes gene_type:complete